MHSLCSNVQKLPRRAVRRQLARQHAAQQRAGTGAGVNSVSRWVAQDTCAACGHTSKRLVQRPTGQQAQEQRDSKAHVQERLAHQQPRQSEQQVLRQSQHAAVQQPQAAAQVASPSAASAQAEVVQAAAHANPVSDAVVQQQQQQQQEQRPQEAAQGEGHKRKREQAEAAAAVAPLATADGDATPPLYAAPAAAGGCGAAPLGQNKLSPDAADIVAEGAAAAPTEPAREAEQTNGQLQVDSAAAATGAAAAEAAAAAAASSGEDSQPGDEERPAKRRRRLSWSEQLQDVRLIDRAKKPRLKRILSWRRLARSWKPAVFDLRRLGPGGGL